MSVIYANMGKKCIILICLKKDSLYVLVSVFNNASFQQITLGADNSKPYDNVYR